MFMRKLIHVIAILVFIMFAVEPAVSQEPIADEQALEIARRLVTLFNQGDFNGAYALFNEDMTKAVTIPQLEGLWKSFVQSKGGYQGETSYAVGSAQGFKIVGLTTQFKNDSQNIIITVNDKGQIAGLFFRPVEQAKIELSDDEQEITFKSGDDTVYGTLLIPKNTEGKVPAVLLLSGSGATDRDGNNSILPGKIDSLKKLARILADAGVASLRYDKYGTGKTGLGSYANKLSSMTFDAYVDLTLTAYKYLESRPEIDPVRLGILGHSEGALIAMVAVDRMKPAPPPAALILAMPPAKPYMTIIHEQISEQYANAVKAGAFTQQQADDGMAELNSIIADVIKDGTAPEKMSPQFEMLFAVNSRFLQTANQYDPPKLAENLPVNIKILVLCGRKDQQVPCDNVKLLVDGFKQGGNTGVQFAELTDVNHVFKEVEGVPDLAKDYIDPAKPFSREAQRIITEFVKATLLR
jgi:alpha-beta hydrolase superfamily lysophospholipase